MQVMCKIRPIKVICNMQDFEDEKVGETDSHGVSDTTSEDKC
jgi:hypothetical protein